MSQILTFSNLFLFEDLIQLTQTNVLKVGVAILKINIGEMSIMQTIFLKHYTNI